MFKPVVLALLAVVPFLPAINGEFLYDDPQMWLGGPPPYPPFPYKGFLKFRVFHRSARALTHVFDSLLWRLFAINATGMDATGTVVIQPSWPWHTLSLAFHVGTVWAVWGLFGLFLEPSRAFAAAAIYAVHPLQVQPVAYVSGRAGVQAAFFAAVGLLHASMGGWHWLAVPVSQYFSYKSKQDGLLYLVLYPVILWKVFT